MKRGIGFFTVFLFAVSLGSLPAMADPAGVDMGCSPTLANPCTGGAAGSGGSVGVSPQDQLLLDAAGQLGAALGEMLRSDPAEDAKRRAEAQQRALEQQGAAAAATAESERKKQEQFARLRGELKLDDSDGDGGGLKLKGVDVGSGGDLALKLDDDELEPLGTRAVPNSDGRNSPTPNPRCQAIISSCVEKLEEQAALLEDADREGKAQFSKAIVEGHLSHGIDMAKDGLLEEGDVDTEPTHVWQNKDVAGLKLQLNPGKATVDDLVKHLNSQRAAALNGRYNPKLQNLLTVLGTAKTDAATAARDGFDWATKLRDEFQVYMRNMVACTKDYEASFNECVSLANKTYDKTVEHLENFAGENGDDTGAFKRVEAARNAYTRYIARFAERSSKLWDEATSCDKRC